MFKKQNGITTPFVITVVVLWLAAIGGWVANLIKMCSSLGDTAVVSTMFVARCVGVVFAPLGAVLGFF